MLSLFASLYYINAIPESINNMAISPFNIIRYTLYFIALLIAIALGCIIYTYRIVLNASDTKYAAKRNASQSLRCGLIAQIHPLLINVTLIIVVFSTVAYLVSLLGFSFPNFTGLVALIPVILLIYNTISRYFKPIIIEFGRPVNLNEWTDLIIKNNILISCRPEDDCLNNHLNFKHQRIICTEGHICMLPLFAYKNPERIKMLVLYNDDKQNNIYTEQCLTAIEDFVRSGGILFLVASTKEIAIKMLKLDKLPKDIEDIVNPNSYKWLIFMIGLNKSLKAAIESIDISKLIEAKITYGERNGMHYNAFATVDDYDGLEKLLRKTTELILR
jgi:hypothetical protein